MSDVAVSLEAITKRFPGVVANDDVDLSVSAGSVHALLGENGAGKTTLMNVLYGLHQPTAGTVRLYGEERDFDSPRDAIDAGVGMIHQHFMLVETMTVTENVVLGNEPRKWGGLGVDRRAARDAVVELADRYGFDVDPDARIEEVSVGEQQRVEIMKALYRGADVLVLDEPTAVLTPQEVEELFTVFEELTSRGKTIIFISHKLDEAMQVADEITVLRDGENVGTVDATETTREELAELMIGREVFMEVEKDAVPTGETALSVSNVSVRDDRDVVAVDDVSFEVRAGEVFGIAGVDGNGQGELVEILTGLRSTERGSVAFDGDDVTDASRRERIRRGMTYVPEDRQARGLVMDYDLLENGLLGQQHEGRFASGGRIDWESTYEHVGDVITEYDVRPPDPSATAKSLSGGNQQKFIVGREFMRDPRVVIAANPTRGVDIGSVEFIHDRILDLRANGKAIVLISSKLDEVKSLSDRLAVMYDGEFVDVVDPATTTESELGLLMGGEATHDDSSTDSTGRHAAEHHTTDGDG